MAITKVKIKGPPNTPIQREEHRSQSTYAGIISALLAKSKKEPGPCLLQNEPLARIEYEAELAIKNEALSIFWQKYSLPGTPEQIRKSPKSRRYRTTSQRRIFLHGNKLFLLFGDSRKDPSQKVFVESLLEPREHTALYVFLQKKLSDLENRVVASHLNYLIIRGNYTNQSLIFNVDLLNGAIVRRLKIISGQLQKFSKTLSSAFIYVDPTRSGYYLEGKKPSVAVPFKKIFGPANLSVEHKGVKYQFHPTSFSQVNDSMVPVMLDEALSLIPPKTDRRLLDLYCGYGLFSCFFGEGFGEVFGVEAEGHSVQSAKMNAKALSSRAKIQFRACRITGESVDSVLPKKYMAETILLDPPKQGPADGVIEALCLREPQAVLHVFCGVDQIPYSLKLWQKNGYCIEKVVPLDMFPGTVNLEVLVLLAPALHENHNEMGQERVGINGEG